MAYVKCGKPGCDLPVKLSWTLGGKVAPNCGGHRPVYVTVAGHRTRSARVIADAKIISFWGPHPDKNLNQKHPYVTCTTADCGATFPWKAEWSERWKRNRRCKPCVDRFGRMKPWEGLYRQLLTTAAQASHAVELTYEEFFELCEQNECHYCKTLIQRRRLRPSADGASVRSVAYFLDRKDDRLPYSVENCVTCCTPCNFTKASWLSYEEMLIVGAVRSGLAVVTADQMRAAASKNQEHCLLIKERTHLRLARWGGRKKTKEQV